MLDDPSLHHCFDPGRGRSLEQLPGCFDPCRPLLLSLVSPYIPTSLLKARSYIFARIKSGFCRWKLGVAMFERMLDTFSLFLIVLKLNRDRTSTHEDIGIIMTVVEATEIAIQLIDMAVTLWPVCKVNLCATTYIDAKTMASPCRKWSRFFGVAWEAKKCQVLLGTLRKTQMKMASKNASAGFLHDSLKGTSSNRSMCFIKASEVKDVKIRHSPTRLWRPLKTARQRLPMEKLSSRRVEFLKSCVFFSFNVNGSASSSYCCFS